VTLHSNSCLSVCLFQALLANSDETGKSSNYKFSEPWLGSSLLLAEGRLMASVGEDRHWAVHYGLLWAVHLVKHPEYLAADIHTDEVTFCMQQIRCNV
jgi:hypothetical protein